MSAAEVLAQHQWRGDVLGCGCRWNWPEERTYFCGEDERIQKAHIAHQLDALKAAGFAVVELPPVEVDEYGDVIVYVPLPSHSAYTRNREAKLRVEVGGQNHRGVQMPTRIATLGVPTPTEVLDAKVYAAALLAAADAAEATS